MPLNVHGVVQYAADHDLVASGDPVEQKVACLPSPSGSMYNLHAGENFSGVPRARNVGAALKGANGR